jgi:hypothetical protein
LALVVLVVFDADADVLGSVLVFESQPDSTIARATAIAAVPEIAVGLMNQLLSVVTFARFAMDAVAKRNVNYLACLLRAPSPAWA